MAKLSKPTAKRLMMYGFSSASLLAMVMVAKRDPLAVGVKVKEKLCAPNPKTEALLKVVVNSEALAPVRVVEVTLSDCVPVFSTVSVLLLVLPMI